MNELHELPADTTMSDMLAGGPFTEDLFRLDELLPIPECPDIIALSRQLDSLAIETNTQSLQLKIERMKRRQLRSSLRSIEQISLRPCPDAASLRQEFSAFQDHQNAINFQFEGDITALRALTFRCLTRMHQTITRFLPHIRLPADDNFELAQMLQEITQTFSHFHSYYTASYV